MKPILLLGGNFVRSQLLLLAIVLAYVVCLAGFVAFHEQLADLVFFIRQQGVYVIALGSIVIVPALQNERRSRRVLGVLSKGIHRWQYLGGLLCGAIAIAAVFCLAVGLSAWWLARQAAMPVEGLGELLLLLFLASAAGASTALFCSVFLHPVLALPATAILLLFPFAADPNGLHLPHLFFPVAAALSVVFNFTLHRTGTSLWWMALAALVHAVIFWLCASALFAHRDVTVATE